MKEVSRDFTNICVKSAWAEEEMEKWITKQALRCLRRKDSDRAHWYEQKMWESYIRRGFYDKQIDRTSEESIGLMRERGEH